MGADIMQLIYISRANYEFSNAELQKLLNVARSKNALRGLSGMLLYHERSFLQVVEGPVHEIEGLFKILSHDPRHTKIKVLFKDIVAAKEFDKWSMGFVDTTGLTNTAEGFVNYKSQLSDMTIGKTTAKKALKLFQEGGWRVKE